MQGKKNGRWDWRLDEESKPRWCNKDFKQDFFLFLFFLLFLFPFLFLFFPRDFHLSAEVQRLWVLFTPSPVPDTGLAKPTLWVGAFRCHISACLFPWGNLLLGLLSGISSLWVFQSLSGSGADSWWALSHPSQSLVNQHRGAKNLFFSSKLT